MNTAIALLEALIVAGTTCAILLLGHNGSPILVAGIGIVAIGLAVQLHFISIDVAVGKCQQALAGEVLRPRPPSLAAVSMPSVRRCRSCGCTEDDCRGCIERTGQPCHWIEQDDLCSACERPDHSDPYYGRLAIVIDPENGEAILSGVVSAELSTTHLRLRTLSGGSYAVSKTDVRFVDDRP